ncbi:MAG: DUF5618 family protein [Ignavibacteriae bacterium]|nr:DUF5618 family protein [Ignavibacteriota bacterium]
MKEPLRYLANAKETLGKSAIEDGRYADDKYVKSACGIAYLGVLKAIDQFLLKKGVGTKTLPRKVEEYEKALRKYAAQHNGKLLKAFGDIYEELHIAGYYRGNLHRVDVVKAALRGAEEFIKKLN